MRHFVVILALLPLACAASSPPPGPIMVDVPSAPPAPPAGVSPDAAAPAAPATGDPPVQRGRLEPAEIQKVVRSSFGLFRSCYERGLLKDPKLSGKVATRFVIARDGSVSQVGDGGSDLPDREVVRCVNESFLKLKFPEPKGGIVTVVYPIMLSPGDPAPPGPAPAGATAASPAPAAPPAASPAGKP
ncbi:AgmX/PglI C-terminal domain-containing protein [Sorangium sp. So ce385]|uniref:AgmX/PglI C-terminal domain-containing protein n=1 Tax=Sorangium sp. So ce385 TaxID=3133308 RepID=UPI003F5B0CD8